jgi:acyl-CoA synthetase (AMP-forming)/AMP-acid ligase II
MSGYWNQPEASGAALAGGWMHTGDAGSLDRDGYLTLADRIKDLIVSGGENIVPREVEAVLLQHPSVADVAVIGTLHARWGEAVTAVVVLRAGASLTLAELDDFCRDKIGGYKRPRRLETVSELPRNASGKLLKRELRERYSGVGPR